jgi:GNAT superfamily N-acetyltransferase
MPYAFTIAQFDGPRLAPGLLQQIDGIFLDASGHAARADPGRTAFRERWLGRYLQEGSDVLLLALAADQTVAGYLVGALHDPSTQPRFLDISYYGNEFRDLCSHFPAHFHVNLAHASRGQGLGARLVSAFAEQAQRAGVAGMHVVTGKTTRAVQFFSRCGLAEVGSSRWNDREIVFLGKTLQPHP